MPLEIEQFMKLKEKLRTFPQVFECECGRRLVASVARQKIRCPCGLIWHVRETFAFASFKGGSYLRYW